MRQIGLGLENPTRDPPESLHDPHVPLHKPHTNLHARARRVLFPPECIDGGLQILLYFWTTRKIWTSEVRNFLVQTDELRQIQDIITLSNLF